MIKVVVVEEDKKTKDHTYNMTVNISRNDCSSNWRNLGQGKRRGRNQDQGNGNVNGNKHITNSALL